MKPAQTPGCGCERRERPDHGCGTAMAQLVDIALRSTATIANDLVSLCSIGTCAPSTGCGCESGSAATQVRRTVRSAMLYASFKIAIERQVTFDGPLSSGYLFIPPDRISFLPTAGRDPQHRPVGLLHRNEATFQVEVDATDLPSAVYAGTVLVDATEKSEQESVQVFIEL